MGQNPIPLTLDIPAYLARLGHTGPLVPSAETLRALHVAHLYAVPFENLDISRGRALSLSRAALFDKIVTRRRGGFCYELNGLFAWLLESLGYVVTCLSARVYNSAGILGPEFDHLVLSVACPADGPAGGRWLADVGFGDSYIEPLRLEPGLEQIQGSRMFWLAERDGRLDYWMRDAGADPVRQHTFTLAPRLFPDDYEPACVYQQTSPQSPFTQRRLCTLATPTGRITVTDGRWIVTENGVRNETAIDDAEFERILQSRFGITLT